MTKFILVGGYPHKAADGGKGFVYALTAGKNEPVKILECLFARPQDNWEKAFAQDKEFFAKHLEGKNYELRLASIEGFAEEIHWADSIYIRGGETDALLSILKQDLSWQKELEGKTFAGSSAGANAQSRYYYGLDEPGLREGLGLLPVKVLVHYRSDYNAPNIDWDKAEAELTAKEPDLPLLPLAEGQFKVFEQ